MTMTNAIKNIDLLVKEITRLVGVENVTLNTPLKSFTSFKIGGPADIMVFPGDVESLSKLMKYLFEAEIKPVFIGNGTNLLVSDKGIRGVVVHTGKNLASCRVEESAVYAQCGTLLSKVAAEALKHSLTGFEFASGIPGTVGGALFMNAGAYGFAMEDVVATTLAMDQNGDITTVEGDDHRFGYRKSRFKEEGLIVLESKFQLMSGEYDTIKEKMRAYNARRKECQPLEYPSAGSVFKRPTGYFAGKLIEDAGLKGCCVGGAIVSEKHAGFIINTGGATAKDVDELMGHIIKRVFECHHVKLEPEIIRIGEF